MDAVTLRSMPNGAGSSERLRMLRRIASALDRPVSDFYRLERMTSVSDTPSAAECDRMLTAFLRVTDPEVRSRIVDLMRAHAGN